MDKYFIIAGEQSGDQHGYKLMQSINKINRSKFIGIGGERMGNEGLDSLVSIEKMSVMGFIEILKHLKFFRKVEQIVLSEIIKEKPKIIILIDYPGFNLRIAKKIKKICSIPIVYYISPQVWAWRESRIKDLKKYIDKILVIFPFENQWYAKRGIKVEWIGHPFMDEIYQISKNEAIKSLGLEINNDKICIALFPGSRNQEINNHLDLFIESANKISNNIKNVKIIINLATHVKIEKKLPSNYLLVRNKQQEVLTASDVAIIASGTATIEAAIYGTPMVVVYKMNMFSWVISKLLIKTKFVAMPNILANKPIVKELIQWNANANNISKYVLKLLVNNCYSDKCKNDLNIVRDSLINGNASYNAAKIITNI